jgi:phosphatidylglycerophosphatase A
MSPSASSVKSAPRRATARLMWRHPAHLLALGLGSGLSPLAPGTVGTLWGWASFLLLQHWTGTGPQADRLWGGMLMLGWFVGCWACARTARSLGVADPGSVVWDEIWAFWLILWVISPVDWRGQCVAFVAFRYFDAAKPGPVAWADSLFKERADGRIGWRQGLGIMLDDLVAALCVLMVLALAVAMRQGGLGAGWLP